MVPSEMESTAQMMPELYRLLYIQRKHQNHAADDEYHCFLSPHSARKKLTQKPYGRPSGQRAFALLHCPLHSRRVYSIPGNVVYRPSTHNNKRIIVEYRVRFPFSSPQIKNVDATPFKFKGFFFIILLFLRQRPETDRDRSKEATAKKRLLKVSFFSIGGIDFFLLYLYPFYYSAPSVVLLCVAVVVVWAVQLRRWRWRIRSWFVCNANEKKGVHLHIYFTKHIASRTWDGCSEDNCDPRQQQQKNM